MVKNSKYTVLCILYPLTDYVNESLEIVSKRPNMLLK